MDGTTSCPGPRVLIVKLSSLGDLFHALPAVHNLQRGLGAEVHWVAHWEYADLVRCFTDVSRVIPFPRRSFLFGAWSFFRELRRVRYEYLVDLQGLLKSALVLWLARGRRRIGPSFHREGTRVLYPEVAGRRRRGRHAVEENLDVIRCLRLERVPPAFPVVFPRRAVAAPRPRVALIPFSRWPSKNWPVEHFVRLGAQLAAARAAVFILGGPADVRACAELAAAIGPGAESAAGGLTLVETGGLIQAMDLVIANDSGPVHMAVAVGTPTLALFGPTDPARTGPYGPGHRVLQSHVPCQPCFSRNCRLKGSGVPCLAQLPPDTVAQAALEMLAAAPRATGA